MVLDLLYLSIYLSIYPLSVADLIPSVKWIGTAKRIRSVRFSVKWTWSGRRTWTVKRAATQPELSQNCLTDYHKVYQDSEVNLVGMLGQYAVLASIRCPASMLPRTEPNSGLDSTQSDLGRSKSGPDRADSDLDRSKSAFRSSKSELWSSKSESGSSKSEPGSSKSEPGSSKSEPGSSKSEPGSSKSEPRSSKSELRSAKSELRSSPRPDLDRLGSK